MHLELDDEEYWRVKLSWSKPRIVDAGELIGIGDEGAGGRAGVYRIERHHHSMSRPEVVRIGIAHSQSLGTRLKQYSVATLDEWRQRGSLKVSYAILDINGRHRRERYEEIEHLLVFVVKPRYNERKMVTVPQTRYRIANLRYRGPVPHEVVYPVIYVGSHRGF